MSIIKVTEYKLATSIDNLYNALAVSITYFILRALSTYSLASLLKYLSVINHEKRAKTIIIRAMTKILTHVTRDDLTPFY